MDPGMVLLATLIKFALVMLLIGWIPALIAKAKGRNFFGWWVYGGALFIVALIHALVMKPRVPDNQQSGHPRGAQTTCDGCKKSFPSNYYLQVVEGRTGYFCQECRQGE